MRKRSWNALIEQAHLFDYLSRLTRPNNLAWRDPVEHVNRAEGAGADASAAREQRNRVLPEDRGAAASVTLGIRQGVEIRNERARWGGDDLIALPINDAHDIAPVISIAQSINHFQQRRFAFETHQAVDSRNQFHCVLIAEAREMAAHRKMARDAVIAQITDESVEDFDVELKDQRKANQDWVQ